LIGAAEDEIWLTITDAFGVSEFEPLAVDGKWKKIGNLLLQDEAARFRRAGAGGLPAVRRCSLSPADRRRDLAETSQRLLPLYRRPAEFPRF
jgi:hypothetical protein